MMTGTHGHPRHGDPAGMQPDDPDVRTRDLKREVYLRQRAVSRLRYMNIQHAIHAWNFRYSDPLAPYGLAQ